MIGRCHDLMRRSLSSDEALLPMIIMAARSNVACLLLIQSFPHASKLTYHVYGPNMTKRDQAMAETFSKYGYMKEGSGIRGTYGVDESSDPDSIGLSGMVTQEVEFVPCQESGSRRFGTGDPRRRTMAPRMGDWYKRPFGLHPLASREGAVVQSLLCIAKNRLEQLGQSASCQLEAYFGSKITSISRLQLAPTLREEGPGRAVTSGRYDLYHLENGWTVITRTL